MGQINVYELSVESTGGEGLLLHFDAYNSTMAENSVVFAPFGHDADFSPYEPAGPHSRAGKLDHVGCRGRWHVCGEEALRVYGQA